MTDGLAALFHRERDFRVVGVATEGPVAMEIVRRTNPDVVVVDLITQAPDGLSLIRQLKKHAPRSAIVGLSMYTDEAYVSQALQNGASAYVLKSESFTDLVHAVREVTAGRQYLSPSLNAHAIRRRTAAGSRPDALERLTPRERQVLQLAAEGRTSAQIAARLGISRRTAETHRANIYKKLLVESHTDLVAFALRRGLLTRDT